jgi:hypothetical protein
MSDKEKLIKVLNEVTKVFDIVMAHADQLSNRKYIDAMYKLEGAIEEFKK